MASNQANGARPVPSGAHDVHADPVGDGEGEGEEPGFFVEEQLTNIHYLRELNKEGQWTVSGAKMGNELNNMLDEKVRPSTGTWTLIHRFEESLDSLTVRYILAIGWGTTSCYYSRIP
jgi:hypothetical protein